MVAYFGSNPIQSRGNIAANRPTSFMPLGISGTKTPAIPYSQGNRGALPYVADRVTNDYRKVGTLGQPNVIPAAMPDFLSQAQGALTGVDYSGVMNDYKGIAAKARARIAAMYKALQGERQDAEALYSGYRDAASESIGASANQAASDIAASYQDAVDQQATEMAALGLADTLAQSAAQNMTEDQGYNAATAAKMGASFKNANELGRAADLGYNQGMIGAAGFASAEGRAQIDQQLSQALAQLAMAQEQANAQLPLQQLQYAQGLQGMWQSQNPTLSASDEIALQRISSDATRSMNQRKDDMVQFFMDKKGMDLQQAMQAANDYFA